MLIRWMCDQEVRIEKRVSGSKSCIRSLLCKSRQKRQEATMQLWIPWWSSRNIDFLQELWKCVKLINVRPGFCNFENIYFKLVQFSKHVGKSQNSALGKALPFQINYLSFLPQTFVLCFVFLSTFNILSVYFYGPETILQ